MPNQSAIDISRTRGFTLIEILMVVVILGIASAIVVPQISSRDDLIVSSAARALMADIIYAQNQAILTQSRQYVKFDMTGQKYTLMSGNWPGTTNSHPVRLDPYVTSFGSSSMPGLKKVTLVSADFNGNATLGFDQLGTPQAVDSGGTTTTLTSGQVVVRCGLLSLTITVSPYTGELTVN